MPSTSSTKFAALPPAVCPELFRPAFSVFRLQNRHPQALPFVIGTRLAADAILAFVLALHSA